MASLSAELRFYVKKKQIISNTFFAADLLA